MKKYEYYYTTKSNNCSKYVMVSMLLIFSLCVASFALTEIRNFYSDESSIVEILKSSFQNSKNSNNLKSKSVLIKENQTLSASERQARAVSSEQNSTTSSTEKSNVYYEEQHPVVVYSKTDAVSPIAYKELNEIPPRQDSENNDVDDDDPYKRPLSDDDDYDYFGQAADSAQPYYRQSPSQIQQQQHQQQQQEQPEAYYRSQSFTNAYHRSPPPPPPLPPYSQYFDDSREDFPAREQNSEEARASQYRDYNNNYYRQRPYATPPPNSASLARDGDRLTSTRDGQQYNRMPMMSSAKQQMQPPQSRPPYPAYIDDYDYNLPVQPHATQPYPFAHYKNSPLQQQKQQQSQYQQISPQYRTAPSSSPSSSSLHAEKKEIETRPQMDVLTIIKSLKTMWDIYQSFTSSWNTIAERHNRKEELAKQKYEQLQKIRINSKKPPSKFNNKRNQTATTKNPRKQATITTKYPKLDSLEMSTNSEEDDRIAQVKKQPPAKVEPRKQVKGDNNKTKYAEGLRDKRQAAMEVPQASTDVGEGRYIKGDPLKGYYDFVITEGSYKFWAAFQVGTAILIIYSTFAAIYYSKVNPLVSDYDYTDYLGGARSLSGGDLDFVDDDDNTATPMQKSQSKSWLEWLPRTGHSLKFILDAIDKLPNDHDEATMENTKSRVNDNYSYTSEESRNDNYKNSKKSNTNYVNTSGENSDANNSNTSKENINTDYEQNEDFEGEKQEMIDNEDSMAIEGSGYSLDETEENRDINKVLNGNIEEDQQNKAM